MYIISQRAFWKTLKLEANNIDLFWPLLNSCLGATLSMDCVWYQLLYNYEYDWLLSSINLLSSTIDCNFKQCSKQVTCTCKLVNFIMSDGCCYTCVYLSQVFLSTLFSVSCELASSHASSVFILYTCMFVSIWHLVSAREDTLVELLVATANLWIISTQSAKAPGLSTDGYLVMSFTHCLALISVR